MKLAATLFLTVLSAATAFAQHQTLTIDPAGSEVRMKLNTTHEVVDGTFHVQSGTVEFDRTHATISGIVIVAAGSGSTGNGSRDKKMNKDILKADQFTTVTFAPTSYSGTLAATGDSTIQVSGVFTLLGTPHDITLPMQVHVDASKATAKTQFTVPYVQWGLRNPSFLFWKAENTVTITLTLLGNISN